VIFMATPLIVLSTKIIDVVLNSGILGGNLANYRAGLVMTPVVMIFAASGQWRSWWSRLFVACNKPLPPVWLNYAFTPSGYVLQFLFLYWCVDTPTLPVWMLVLGMPGFINNVAQTIVGYIWFQRSILKIGYKQMFWQCAMAPILTAACYAGVLVLFQLFLWPPLEALFVIIAGAQWGPFVLAFLVLMMILFLFPSVFMCPFYSFWGGWDEFTLEEFRKCMLISGPSKGLMNMMYKISLWVAKRSPLHNKFPLANYELVTKQLQELIDEGRATKLMRRGK